MRDAELLRRKFQRMNAGRMPVRTVRQLAPCPQFGGGMAHRLQPSSHIHKHRWPDTSGFDPEMAWTPPPSGKRGRQQQFSDAAIQTCLTLKVLFGMPLCQTTGFVQSLRRLVEFDWAVPDFSTLCRRQKTLNVSLLYRETKEALNLLIDSTVIKAEGEGE